MLWETEDWETLFLSKCCSMETLCLSQVCIANPLEMCMAFVRDCKSLCVVMSVCTQICVYKLVFVYPYLYYCSWEDLKSGSFDVSFRNWSDFNILGSNRFICSTITDPTSISTRHILTGIFLSCWQKKVKDNVKTFLHLVLYFCIRTPRNIMTSQVASIFKVGWPHHLTNVEVGVLWLWPFYFTISKCSQFLRIIKQIKESERNNLTFPGTPCA